MCRESASQSTAPELLSSPQAVSTSKSYHWNWSTERGWGMSEILELSATQWVHERLETHSRHNCQRFRKQNHQNNLATSGNKGKTGSIRHWYDNEKQTKKLWPVTMIMWTLFGKLDIDSVGYHKELHEGHNHEPQAKLFGIHCHLNWKPLQQKPRLPTETSNKLNVMKNNSNLSSFKFRKF